jgi:hypothetical protein
MSEIDQLLQQLPTDAIAARLGEDPAAVQSAARAALPALFGGLQANAADPAGESSLLEALQQHDPSLVQGGVDLDAVDTQDGAAITHHIFGSNEDEVVNRLGAAGGGAGSGLVKKLLPILAPIVLSYLMGKLQQGGGAGFPGGGGAAGGQGAREGGVLPGTNPPADTGGLGGGGAAGGGLGDILGSILGGAAGGGAPTQQQGGMPSTGSIVTDILGGLLGGGRR